MFTLERALKILGTKGKHYEFPEFRAQKNANYYLMIYLIYIEKSTLCLVARLAYWTTVLGVPGSIPAAVSFFIKLSSVVLTEDLVSNKRITS